MTLHLLKLCVGIDSVDHLVARQRRRLAAIGDFAGPAYLTHVTRNMPKRAAELLDGGSLYWVIRGRIRARQRLVGIEPLFDADGRRRCELRLDPTAVRTRPRPQRPIQGWRYLPPAAAPPDLDAADGEDVAPEMMAELRALGLL